VSDIFLSHVEDNFDIAEEIAHAVGAAGYTTWYYERDSVSGEPFLITIGKAIQQCRAIILIISKQALEHGHQITPEVFQAFEGHKRFLPLLLDVSFEEFRVKQPEWYVAIAGAVATSIPASGVSSIIPKILNGLKAAGIEPDQAQRPLPPDELEAGLVRIRQLLNDPNRLASAQTEIRSLLQAFPDAPKVHQLLGEYYNRSFRYPDAVEAFAAAAELEPTNALLHWDLALAYRQAGRDREAFDSLQRAMELGLDQSRQRHAMTLIAQLRHGDQPGSKSPG